MTQSVNLTLHAPPSAHVSQGLLVWVWVFAHEDGTVQPIVAPEVFLLMAVVTGLLIICFTLYVLHVIL